MESLKISVRWVDIDMYDHVNNSKYFDYMTEIRAQRLMKLSVDNPNVQFILADTSCRFKVPITFPNDVIVEQVVTDIRHSSFRMNYRFFTANNLDTVCATGYARMVCYDITKRSTCDIPDAAREYLNQHLEEVE